LTREGGSAQVVSEEEICAAIADVYDDFRSVVEPAGALAVRISAPPP
jgi:threonine dehydratase